MAHTIRAQNVEHHKTFGEANALRAAFLRAQTYNTLKIEKDKLQGAAFHAPLAPFAAGRLAYLASYIKRPQSSTGYLAASTSSLPRRRQ